jgi:hypothetical protein
MAVEHWVEAHRIAKAMEDAGTLAPADSWMVEETRRQLGAARAAAP